MTRRVASGSGGVALASLALAVASLAIVAPAPTYDPWAWLLWGREATELRLSTPEGPAFKPLPVAICALLAPLGDAAPWLWVLVARTAAVGAVLLAFRLGRRLAGGLTAGGLLAAAAVAVTGHYAGYAAAGVSEGILLCCALAALESHRGGRPRTALAWLTACALLRVETWPLLALAAVVAWRRCPSLRVWLVVAGALVPAAWFVPELLGSGDLLRSGARARIPNPGQPALAPVPALASLAEALRLVSWLLWLGIGALAAHEVATRRRTRAGRRPQTSGGAPQESTIAVSTAPRGREPGVQRWAVSHPLAPAAVGLAWIAIVAAMAQVGFSGESRYAMPGAALVGISGGVGLARLIRALPGAVPAAGLTLAVCLLIVVPRAGELSRIPAAQAHQWSLLQDLQRAVERVGGRDRVLACGTPYVGRLRGPLMAYTLDVEKSRVEPDDPPRPPGVVFRSRLSAHSKVAPRVTGEFAPLARVGSWRMHSSCRTGAGDLKG